MKELPYFRFTVAEWMNGNISYEADNIKGVFADICAFYWFRDCSVTKAMLKKSFSNKEAELKVLFDNKIIKENIEDNLINILFLDEQYPIALESRKRRQKAGRKGGKKKKQS